MDRNIKERTFRFSLRIINMYQKIPKTGVGFILGKQLVRAGTSIGANVEEATAATSKNDFTYRMTIALREARETNYWLRLMSESDVIGHHEFKEMVDESDELKKILGAIVRTLRSKSRPG